jgi:hypothetical protein
MSLTQATFSGMEEYKRRNTPMDLLQLAIEREGSIDVIERLARLQIEFMDRDAKLAYTQAFEEFKANVPSVVKDSVILVNEQPRGKYAKLDKICNTLIPALLKVGITHRWKTRMTEDGKMVLVTCFLRHRLGHEEDGSTLGGPPDTSGSKNAIQACGSTVSYLERYTLVASCGISIQDQDNIDSGIQTKPEDLLEESVVRDFVAAIEGSNSVEQLKGNYQAATKAGIKDASALKAFDKAKKDTWKKRGFSL